VGEDVSLLVMAGRSRRLRIEEVQQRWCFSLAASAFWVAPSLFGWDSSLRLLCESIAVYGSMGEIGAPAITGINRPRRCRWKCLCQCRARPEIIIMGEPQVKFPIIGTIIYLQYSIVCSLCTHNTSPSLLASASPFLHPAAGKAAQVVRICAPPL
jgi:hypothetical protein